MTTEILPPVKPAVTADAIADEQRAQEARSTALLERLLANRRRDAQAREQFFRRATALVAA